MKKISVIIPIRNEQESLEMLIFRISETLKKTNYDFEIIAIDDYSTDNSLLILHHLAKPYPQLKYFKKTGPLGKGNAILEGIKKASGEIIVQIDADLAYPPELIPQLADYLQQNNIDIVVGNRIYVNGERIIKKIAAKIFKFFFGRLLFGLRYDVQSGLKVFKKEVFNHLNLNPSKWGFDIEFLFKATQLGYKIEGYPIDYGSRKKGKGKMNLLSAGIELLLISLKLWVNPLEPVLIKKETIHQTEIGFKKKRYKPYTNLSLKESAINLFSFPQFIFLSLLIIFFLFFFLKNWHQVLIYFVTLVSFLYFADLLFNLFLIIFSLRKNPEIKISKEEINKKKDWPIYTIICPLYKEWTIVPQFINAIDKLDYPKNKLQVIFALEEDDEKTIAAVKKINLPKYFQIVIIPHSIPKTKPKACNYALSYAKGKYLVIYDAEDIPEKSQLKKAVLAFEKINDKKVVCLQAKLNFYNSHQNLLTKLFTLEYSLWFDLILTGLHSIEAPIPLGGTSNHFKRESLQLLQGWDPFNVTEDCDLGIRLFKYGFKTKILDSITMEEANSDFFLWFKQRSRWNKGYIQTYFVHMRQPHEFLTDWTNPHIITFQLIVGGKILSSIINPFLWLMTLGYFSFRKTLGPFIESLYPSGVFYVAVFSLVFGNFLYFYCYMIGAAKREQWEMVKYAFFVPFYWLMMSIGTWIAIWQIFTKPHYWEKTKHGLHLDKFALPI
jgi:cellulose synthase/poly-beta-1,6-N-acetylglucosamine synthase-like glycosyltransferase